ncbi:MAG: hemolysin family protein [Planctomycetota bacterium]
MVPVLLAPPVVATVAADLTYAATFLLAEVLVVFSTWATVALDLFSRSRVTEIAAARGLDPAGIEMRLGRTASYEVSVRILRFVGSALLVAGIAFLFLRDHLDGGGDGDAGIPWGPLGTTLAVTFLVSFVLNDVLVRLIARREPDAFLVRALPYLDGLRMVTAPVRIPLCVLVRLTFRVKLEDPGPSAREEVLESVEEGEREGSLTADEADMIESIIDLGRATVDDVFTPRGEVAMIQGEATLEDAVRFVLEHGHRRVPVYGRDRDDVIGVIYAFDLLEEVSRPEPRTTVKEIMRPPFFVPEGKPLNQLLEELRARRSSLAIVTNEYGGTAGLVTMADILEEIVGEIEDEHDREEPEPRPGPDGAIVVGGRTPIEDVNELLSISLPAEEDFETVGGLVFHRMGRVPKAGDRIEVGNVTLTVTGANERTVKSVRVQVRPA